jgi:hypothetical protein
MYGGILMKKFVSGIVLLAAAFTLYAGGGQDSPAPPRPGAQAGETRQAPAAPPHSSLYYSGDGGSGKSLGIVAPDGQGLSSAESHLPAMVQGCMVSDFRKFSNIDILDRQNLDKLLAETESAVYAESADVIRFGEVTQTQYMLQGLLIKTASGYNVSMSVQDTKTAQTAAAYSGVFSAAELDNLQGVKRATGELLSQMGVNLTEAGKNALFELDQNAVNGERALAQGITAQKRGTVIEAQSYYYEAVKFDPSLAEAASRSSVLSADISSGNLGENIRNEIQQRNAWKKTIDEAAAFFKAHPPYEIIYDPALTQERINVRNRTASLSFKAGIICTTGMRIIYDLEQGLEKTGKSREWGISTRSIFGGSYQLDYTINVVLIDEQGEIIGRARQNLSADARTNFSDSIYTVFFENVDANKISDKLTVSIVDVNGIDAKAAGERGYMSISAEAFPISSDQFDFNYYLGCVNIVGYKGTARNVVIPSRISRWPVVSIFGSNNKYRDITSLTIPDSVTHIDDNLFTFNNIALIRVTMPANVTLLLPRGGSLAEHSNFANFYYSNGKKAGTYSRKNWNSEWSYVRP